MIQPAQETTKVRGDLPVQLPAQASIFVAAAACSPDESGCDCDEAGKEGKDSNVHCAASHGKKVAERARFTGNYRLFSTCGSGQARCTT